MPNSVIAETGWVRSRRQIVVLLVAAMVFAGVFFVSFRSSGRNLKVGSHRFSLEVATTDQEQRKGLSGRRSLPGDQGMLFVFQDEGEHCFWMKDMHFALDILWLDGQRRVVHKEQKVLPGSYPKTYCPSKPAVYVLELPEGTVAKTGIRVGETLHF
jgi:uncharacterized protein